MMTLLHPNPKYSIFADRKRDQLNSEHKFTRVKNIASKKYS